MVVVERPYKLSCHCGAIRIEVDAPLGVLTECNCSSCARHGFLSWRVKSAAVKLLTWKVQASVYMWRDVQGHTFCPVCGVGLMRTGYPDDEMCVNARCIEGVDIFTFTVERYDGRHDMLPGPYD
jgi:hypothetical protein